MDYLRISVLIFGDLYGLCGVDGYFLLVCFLLNVGCCSQGTFEVYQNEIYFALLLFSTCVV